MLLYRRINNQMQLCEGNDILSLPLAEEGLAEPVLNWDKQYAAFHDGRKICIYDRQNGRLIDVPVRCRHAFGQMRFDRANRLYCIDGNTIFRWQIGASTLEPLYTLKRAQHGPRDIGVSPDGRYVSFRKYRADSYWLFLLDTATGECRDLKTSIYHYIWVDNTHLAWTKGAGLKLLDASTGKSKTLIRDHTTLLKKISQEDAAHLAAFASADDEYPIDSLDLLGLRDGMLYFSLTLYQFSAGLEHRGIWRVKPDGTAAQYCFPMPAEFQQTAYQYFTEEGHLVWLGSTSAVFDGSATHQLTDGWQPACLFTSRNR